MELLPLVCLCLLSCSGDAGRVVVEEDSDAVLPCLISTKENLEGKLFDWKKDGQKEKKEVFLYDAGNHYNNGRQGQDEQFKGRVSHFPDQLKNGNASIKITRTKMADSGNYSCHFPRLQSQPSIIELVVGLAPEPIINIRHVTKDGVLLQCEARGDPPPTVEWMDSAGNTLRKESTPKSERGSPSSITLNITVTKTDDYRCVATQKEFNHQIFAVTSVYIQVSSEPYVTTIRTDNGTVLQCAVLGASPKPKVEWKDSSGKNLQAEEPKVTERGGSYNIVLRAAVTKTDTFRCVVTQEEIRHQNSAEIYADGPGSNTGAIVAGVVCGALGLCIGGFLVWLCMRHRDNKRSMTGSTLNTANGPTGAELSFPMIGNQSEPL